MTKNMIQLGEAGVLRVMSELILRGHSPYKPAVDDHGVDLMLSTGIRIQVKTATLKTKKTTLENKGGRKTYETVAYHLRLGASQVGIGHKYAPRKKLYSTECDYFVIWGVDENRFWIVPSFVMDNRHCLVLGIKAAPTQQQVMELAGQGKGLQEIAKALGVCEVTVWKRKKGDIRNGSFVRAVRQCEDMWEFLNSKPQSFVAQERNAEAEVRHLEKMLSI